MTKKETALILATLRAAYPGFYRDMTPEDAQTAANLWQGLFADEDYKLVSAAVQTLIKTRTSTFPPVPGEVTEQIYKLAHQDELGEAEAWALVKAAAARGTYNATEEFDALPPAVQSVVRSPAQLRSWAQMDTAEFESVVASNFQRSYRARRAQDREFEALPAGAREVAKEIAGALFKALSEGKEIV